MAKELTNRQLAEAVGYALEKAERNLNASVIKLEKERKRIESFKVDTHSADQLFKDANEAFRLTSNKCVADLDRIKSTKTKEVQIKEWIFYFFMLLATLGSLIWGGYSYYQKSELEKQNKKMQESFNNVYDFFEENPKQKEGFKKWMDEQQKVIK